MASILPSRGTCKKMREVFVLHPIMEKNLSLFLKIRFHLPKNGLIRRHDEQVKIGKNLKKQFFFRDWWYSGPP
jgi:hypothetical protein